MKLTAEQLRAARALVRVDQSSLAKKSGVGIATIKRLETSEGELNAQEATIANLRSTLEAEGVIFLDDKEGTPRGGPGVRLAEKRWESTEEHVQWIRDRLLRAVENLDLHDLSREDQRQRKLVAMLGTVDEAEGEFLWKFTDAESGVYREALGKALSEIMGLRSGASIVPPKKPRKHYDRTDPESGSGMNQRNRPVARRAQIKPTSDDDESE